MSGVGIVPSTPISSDALYDDAPCGLLITAPDGLIQRVNRTFCSWVGRDPGELVGRVRLQDLLTMGGRIFHHTHWGPLMQIQGSVSEVKLEVVHRDGDKLPAVWNAVRRIHADHTVHEVAVFIAEDRHKYEQELLTARRRAEELLAKEQAAQAALRDAQVERDRQRALAEDRALFAEQMMAIVSHDLRNPLSVIRMSVHILSTSELSEKQTSVLARLDSSAKRANRLIADLLDFSRGRIGTGLKVRFDHIDLHAVISEAIDDLRIAYPGHPIEHHRLGTGSCKGSCDRLTQLIGNLVMNAIAYGSSDHPVVVTSLIDEHECRISVQNQGPAIAQDLLPRLFDPMARGAPDAGQPSSVGLGLFIVREIAQAHGGEVEVDSSDTQGTTFEVRFPKVEAPRPSAAQLKLGKPLDAAAQERFRQAELDRLAVSHKQDAAYDDIVRLAAETCDVPIALITLVDGGRQWFKARIGLQVSETPREHAFCAHAIQSPGENFIVEDASVDPRFVANPLVTGDPSIRFYAGAPLVTREGIALGTVCVLDTAPRTLDGKQLELLRFLAQQVVDRLERGRPPAADLD